ncbi:unnamed protein product [Rotaria socialis]
MTHTTNCYLILTKILQSYIDIFVIHTIKMKTQHLLIGLFTIILLVVRTYSRGPISHGLVLRDDDDQSSLINTSGPLTADNDTTTATRITSTATPVSTSSATSDSSTTATTTSVTTATTATTTSGTTATADTTTTSVTTKLPDTTTTQTATSTATTELPTANTTAVTTGTTSAATTTTPSKTTTTAAPGRKFDGLSFMGGIILAVGVGALAYLVVRYLRRTNRLRYGTLA